MSWSVLPWVRTLTQYRDKGAEFVVDEAKEEEKFILDLNRDQLYNDGTDYKPTPIGQYAASTVQYKARTGQRYDHITLHDSGAFHASFFVVYDVDEFTIFSDDDKTPELISRYGPEVLGLTSDNLKLLIDHLRPAVVDQFRKKMLS